MTHVLMLAAEHGGLPGGKVGGIGDVIAEMPPGLVAAGLTVDVLVPAYGLYHEHEGSRLVASVDVDFAGSLQRVELYQLRPVGVFGGANCWVIHHPVFAQPAGQIYHHDSADSPFATDANIYALFCAAALELLAQAALPTPDVVHLHDWHAATFALLCRSFAGPRSDVLTRLKIVYTVHNLALQGVRPLTGHPSSLAAWFPNLTPPVEDICDPRYPDCYNPMRAGIVLADRVHVVSPGYAQEVLLPDAPELGRHGGEGLEEDLALRAAEGDLFGILNGCEYPTIQAGETPAILQGSDLLKTRVELAGAMRLQLAQWFRQHATMRSSDYLADKVLGLSGKRLTGALGDCFLVTSVGRVTQQKMGLLLHEMSAGHTLLDALLLQLGKRGLLVLLGSGDEELESQLVEHAARHDNFVFLRGYSDVLAAHLYRSGDLFLMPSLYEPCGISQLLAMRDGQPCLVHAVGGLRDTVSAETGFLFEGENLVDKVRAANAAFGDALRAREDDNGWNRRRALAAANRFSWSAAAASYVEHLYR